MDFKSCSNHLQLYKGIIIDFKKKSIARSKKLQA